MSFYNLLQAICYRSNFVDIAGVKTFKNANVNLNHEDNWYRVGKLSFF
jgi:hypothetical protein